MISRVKKAELFELELHACVTEEEICDSTGHLADPEEGIGMSTDETLLQKHLFSEVLPYA